MFYFVYGIMFLVSYDESFKAMSNSHTLVLHLILDDSKSRIILPSIDVIAPRESVFPEQEPGVASQGAKHEEDAGDDPG